MPQPLNLTFGIELECIVRYPRATYIPALEKLGHPVSPSSASEYDHMLAKIVREHIALYLTNSGHETRHPSQSQTPSAWIISSASSIRSSPLFHQEETGYAYCDIKIKSPTLPLSPKAFSVIEDAIYNLTHITDLEIIFDTSCGLHVHVGSENAGFPLQTLKNFSILTTVFEAQLSSLHPPERAVNNAHIERQSAVSAGKSPWDIATEIQLCRNNQELVSLWTNGNEEPDDDLAYNLCQLISKPGFSTIEFRQHEATKDTDEIIKWVELTTALVRYAHEVAFEDLMLVVEDLTFDVGGDIVGLLFALGLTELAVYYRGRELYEHPRPEGAWDDELRLGCDTGELYG